MQDHPAIKQLGEKLNDIARFPKDEQPAKRDKLVSDIGREQQDLMQSLIKQSRDPVTLNRTDIHRLKDLKIQEAYLACGDSTHPAAHDRILKAINGQDASGAFNFPQQMENALDRATATPKTRAGLNLKAGNANGIRP